MAVRVIVKHGDPVLHRPTQPVGEIDDELRALVRDMVETMYAAPGVGLAANQIGVSLRLAVVDISVGKEAGGLLTLINPYIISEEGALKEEEGCLSVPSLTETLRRSARVRVRARDLEGSEREYEAEGLLARAFAHEIDHLEGKLYVDRLRGLKRDLMMRKIKKIKDRGEWD